MSFFFDCRFIRIDHHDGISRFSSELFESVSKLAPVTALICDLEQLQMLPQDIDYLQVNDPKNPWLELWLPRRLNRQGATVVFSPMQTMGSLAKKYKLILTLHDLIYYKYRKPPASLAWPIRVVWWLFHLSFTPVRMLLNRADAVVTISETSKSLIEKNKLTRKPIHVVYNASSMPHADSIRNQPVSRNLLYMGSFMPYKNVELIIKAMSDLPEYTLTLCSKVSLKRKEQLLAGLSKQCRDRIFFMNGVSESEYLQLLDQSFALVSASKDEGFGIPLIEAMTRAIPVVVSDIPIFHEVCGEAGNFFNPENSVDFVEAVNDLQPKVSWQIASRRSFERASSFDWSKSAKELLEIAEVLRG